MTSAPPRPKLFTLAWPLFVELLLGILVSLVGTALAARVSDEAGAAFALANQVATTLFIVFRIIAVGIGVTITQNLGAGQREGAERVARAALGASTWLGGATALIALAGAAPMLQLMGSPPELLPLATPFLMALGPVMLLDAWNASMAGVMRAHLRTRDALAVVIVMHTSHLALAIPLMLGWGPLPAMGLIGFAVALCGSRLIGVGLHLWLWRLRLNLVPHWPDWWRAPRRELNAILHIGLPGAAENIAYRVAYMVSVGVAAHLGTKALATQAYTTQIMYSVLLFSLAVGLSVEILVGHQIGAGHWHAAHKLVRRGLGAGILVSLAVALVMALGGPWLLRIFTNDPEIIRAGSLLLWLTVLLEPGRSFNLVVINALRATGDARFPVAAGSVSMAIVLAGGSWLLGQHFGWGLVGVWIAYIADEWIRGLIMWHRWATLRWLPHARAVRRRLRAAKLAEASKALGTAT